MEGGDPSSWKPLFFKLARDGQANALHVTLHSTWPVGLLVETFDKHLLCAQRWFRCFVYVNSFNLHIIIDGETEAHREKLSNMPKVLQLDTVSQVSSLGSGKEEALRYL